MLVSLICAILHMLITTLFLQPLLYMQNYQNAPLAWIRPEIEKLEREICIWGFMKTSASLKCMPCIVYGYKHGVVNDQHRAMIQWSIRNHACEREWCDKGLLYVNLIAKMRGITVVPLEEGSPCLSTSKELTTRCSCDVLTTRTALVYQATWLLPLIVGAGEVGLPEVEIQETRGNDKV